MATFSFVPRSMKHPDRSDDVGASGSDRSAADPSGAAGRALFASLEDGVCLLERLPTRREGPGYRCVAANPAMQRMFGIRDLCVRSIGEVLGQTSADLYDRFDRVLDTGSPMRFACGFAAQGTVLEVFLSRADDGIGQRLLAVMRDVTQRQANEDALRASHERLSRMLEVDGVGTMIWDTLTGCMLDANDAFLRMMGYSRADVLARALTWQDLTPPEFHELSLGEMRKFATTGRVGPYEKQYLRKDGSRLWLLFTGSAIGDGQCVEYCVDISAHKLAEQALREGEARLRVAKRAAGIGIHDFDPRTGRIFWDDRARQIWGVAPDAPITYEAFRAGLHPDDVATVERAVQSALDPTGSGHFFAHYRVINRLDHLERWVEATGEAAFEDGQAVRLVGTVCDITERKRAETSLKDAAREKDQFLAMLAHELRNPLAPIRNASEVLARVLPDDPALRRPLGMIARQAAHLERLVDDLLDVSRIARGLIELQQEVLDLSEVLDQASESVQPLANERQHELRVHRPRRGVHVRGDRTRLVQVFANLLNNAAKYTEPGGTITLDVTASPNWADIEVRDNGTGIAPDLLPRIFDVFVQSERTLDRSAGGLGIGLSVVKRLVEMHGGSVRASSAGAGQGATFSVRLPRASVPDDIMKGAASSAPVTAPRRVLVVDDNRDAADSLGLLLELLGHQVQVVYGGAQALQAFDTGVPDIALIDIGMPSMDGYAVARRVRASGARLVAVTGYGQETDRASAADAGFHAHLLKPASLDALRQVLAGSPRVGADATAGCR